MSADSSTPHAPPARPPMDYPERRGPYCKRATSRMNRMKRRSSGMATPRATSPVAGAPETMRAIEPVALPTDQIALARSDTATPPMAPPLDADTGLLAAETEDETEEPLHPMVSSRTGITQERARVLFAKYGMEYGSRSKQPTTSSEPPSKIRRVEKPVRLRVHWTCHECSRQFGMERTCFSCGHRRCTDCTRHPPKRVREVLENTRREMKLRDAIFAEPSTEDITPAVDLDLERYQLEPSVPVIETTTIPHEESEVDPNGAPRTQNQPVSGIPSLSSPLELDDEANNNEIELPSFQFFIYAHPRAGISAVLKPKHQLVRRQCHKCETRLLPPSRSECQNCGHARCAHCPRYPPKPPTAGEVAEEPPIVQAVQRVYRKPRQRVRYTCEDCNTLFLGSNWCFECGHGRCGNCTREPPKRAHDTHHAAVIQAVADRLAAYGPPGITASAG